MTYLSPNLLAEAPTTEAFAAALASACRASGFEHYLAVHLSGSQLESVTRVLENAPPEAGDVKGLAHWSIVRMLERMRKITPPLVFGLGAEPPIELPGYTTGIAAHVRGKDGVGIFYFGRSGTPLQPSEIVPAMRAVLMAAVYGGPILARGDAQVCPLTAKEFACLQHFAAGLSAKQTAQVLGLSYKTVEHHLASIRKRMGVDSTSAAAYKALNLGWLTTGEGGGAGAVN